MLPIGGACLLGAVVLTACLSGGQAAGGGGATLPNERGEASYYADKFAGRTTASGETYDPDAMTAAHRSLPFGTKVRVVRAAHPDEPAVVVRINDRGPFAGGRIIDLSKAAARELGMMGAGVVEVKLELVGEAPQDESTTPASGGW
jgi:rare lipoprotein A